MTIILGYDKLQEKFPKNRCPNLFQKRHIRLSWIGLSVLLLPLIAGCPKKIPSEAYDIQRSISLAREECASVYAQEELDDLEIMIIQMKQKKKYKEMRKMALDILPRIEKLRSTINEQKQVLRLQVEEKKEMASENISSALKNQAIDYAPDLMARANNLFQEGEQFKDDRGCQLKKALHYFQTSAQSAEKANEKTVEEKNKQIEREEARKLQEKKKVRVPEKPKEKITEWIVASGENLWTISSKNEVYGNPLLWPLLFWANRSQIKNPNLIYSHQRLKIPREFQEEDLEKARNTVHKMNQTSQSD